jgi:hypothetical protein
MKQKKIDGTGFSCETVLEPESFKWNLDDPQIRLRQYPTHMVQRALVLLWSAWRLHVERNKMNTTMPGTESYDFAFPPSLSSAACSCWYFSWIQSLRPLRFLSWSSIYASYKSENSLSVIWKSLPSNLNSVKLHSWHWRSFLSAPCKSCATY